MPNTAYTEQSVYMYMDVLSAIFIAKLVNNDWPYRPRSSTYAAYNDYINDIIFTYFHDRSVFVL